MRIFAILSGLAFGLLLLGSVVGMQESFADTTIEFNQESYSWRDKIYFTIINPEFDNLMIDKLKDNSVTISTNFFTINNIQLEELAPDRGFITGEIFLTGFEHDIDGDGIIDVLNHKTSPDGSGPILHIENYNNDMLLLSFEQSEDSVITKVVPIRWNIGEIKWRENNYYASQKSSVIRVIDPDMNLNPEEIDYLNVKIFSDSDKEGFVLELRETNKATGIFEDTVYFTTEESQDQKLLIKTGDYITVIYYDHTTPSPYTVIGISDIAKIIPIPPLREPPRYNLRTIDEFGNHLDTFLVNQPIQITTDLANGQQKIQPFVYIVQIKDNSGKVVFLDWETGALQSGQSFNPALSWIPEDRGRYIATVFVWESLWNSVSLDPPFSTTITVKDEDK